MIIIYVAESVSLVQPVVAVGTSFQECLILIINVCNSAAGQQVAHHELASLVMSICLIGVIAKSFIRQLFLVFYVVVAAARGSLLCSRIIIYVNSKGFIVYNSNLGVD